LLYNTITVVDIWKAIGGQIIVTCLQNMLIMLIMIIIRFITVDLDKSDN